MDVMGQVHSIETFGTVDGPGIRYVMFLQGCPLRCKFCHNPDTWEHNKGNEISSQKVIDEIKQYLDFYKSSGGGVTASGGEPTMQPEFVQAVFEGARNLGLNTALDTSGFAQIDKIENLMALTDLVLLDIKETTEAEHLELTGVSNRLIENFALGLEKRKIPIWVRHVIIPGITDRPDRIRKLAEFLLQFEMIQRVELLGYHKMGSHKWQLKGCQDPLESTPAASDEQLETAKEILRKSGVKNVI